MEIEVVTVYVHCVLLVLCVVSEMMEEEDRLLLVKAEVLASEALVD